MREHYFGLVIEKVNKTSLFFFWGGGVGTLPYLGYMGTLVSLDRVWFMEEQKEISNIQP